MKLLSKDTKKALPYKYYFIPVLLITLAGIGDTIYLALSHYRNYTNISYASFCAISKAINCDTVSQSPWSILFDIPVALWGLIGYLLFLTFLIPVRNKKKSASPLWAPLFVLALGYSLTAIFFSYISAQKIQSYCLFCLFSYAISFSLLLYCWIIRRRFPSNALLADLKQSLSLIIETKLLKYPLTGLLLVVLSLRLFLPHYWQYQFPEPDVSIPTGITDSGHPWIGATTPRLTIVEFTDYQCFQCAKMHHFLRQLVADNPEKIRLVHRNYPMDNEMNPILVPEPFHIGSGRLALLSIAAQDQNKFWQVNDVIFKVVTEKKNEVDIQQIAKEAQADPIALAKGVYAKDTIKKLESDIRAGLRLKITGTPAYLVNGKLYLGNLPETLFKEFY